jgi:hypothetical protein
MKIKERDVAMVAESGSMADARRKIASAAALFSHNVD